MFIIQILVCVKLKILDGWHTILKAVGSCLLAGSHTSHTVPIPILDIQIPEPVKYRSFSVPVFKGLRSLDRFIIKDKLYFT